MTLENSEFAFGYFGLSLILPILTHQRLQNMDAKAEVEKTQKVEEEHENMSQERFHQLSWLFQIIMH